MESITKFLDPKALPDAVGDDLDVEKEIKNVENDLSDESDTVEVNLSDKTENKSTKDVVLPGKKESDEYAGAVANQAAGSKEEDSADSAEDAAEETEEKGEKAKAAKAKKEEEEKSDDAEEDKEASDDKEDSEKEEKEESEKEEKSEEKEDEVKEEVEQDDVDAESEEAEESSEDADTEEEEKEDSTSGKIDVAVSDLEADQDNVPLLKLVKEFDFNSTNVYEVPNGAKVVHVKSDSDLCICSFDFKVGSYYEDDSNRGISHLLEHLMFNGCPGISSLEFNEKLDRLGMHVNAFTDRMNTAFHFSGLKANFIPAFELYFTLLNSFTPTQEIVDKERGVVINEIGVYNDRPWSVLSETIHSQAYRQHPVTHPILGYEDVIRNISVDQVKSWYGDNYNAKNLTVYLVGDFPEEDLVFVASKLQLFRDGNVNPDPVITDAMALPFYKNIIAHKEGITQTLIDSSVPFFNEAFTYYELSILSNVLGGSMSSYLWNEFREERSIAYSVGAYHSNIDPRHLNVHCYAGLNNAEDAELAKGIFKDAFVYAKAISEDDFNKGLNITKSENLSELETQSGILDVVRGAFYLGFDLDAYVTTINNLTYDSYQSFAEQIDPEKMVTGILYPLNAD